jgi:integrase
MRPGLGRAVMSEQSESRKKRNYGSGGLRQIGNSWYGTWRDPDGRKIQRKVGTVRTAGLADGITKPEAEKKLARMIVESGQQVPLADRVTMEVAGGEYCRRLAVNKDRKKSYKLTQAADLRNHIAPFFGSKTLDKITPGDVERYIADKQQTLSIKTIRNHVNTMHSVFGLGMRQGWCAGNPVKLADRPVIKRSETRIQFLNLDELEQLVGQAYPSDPWSKLEPILYLTAAMTGLRQGELIALRWRDVDFDARRIRVVQNYVRDEFTAPKSEKSSRSVPMASKVAAALSDLRDWSEFVGPDDLVFAHPDTGKPLDRSKLIRRFKQALDCAELPKITFHELRHTFGTTMAAAGEPQRNIQEWMGHDDLKTTQVYMHYAPRHNEVEAVDRAFS